LGNGGTTNVSIPIPVTGISNVIAIAAGCDQTIALTADKRVWTWGGNAQGDLGRTGDVTRPGLVSALTNMSVVAIAGGNQFTLAVTSNGQVYAFGDNTYGQLGTNGIGSASTPIAVAGISNAVLVAAHSTASHSLAMTVDQGTNRYWAWGWNIVGEVGNGTSGNSVYAPAALQFCTRCQRSVQLGTAGSFTAQCNGTMYLYFNDDQTAFGDNSGSYTVSFDGLSTNVNVLANNVNGVAVETVTNGGVYSYSASGFCIRNSNGDSTDPNANDQNTNSVPCSSINITNTVCPTAKCFSLVGKIQ
jgi:alpha-tubulin suppressor-like RCC1 family protein